MSAAVRRLLLLAALLLFLFFADVPEHSRFWSAFFDAGHAALFGVSALLIEGLLRDRRIPRPSLPAFVLTVALGAATEILQVLQRRGDPSVSDLLRDTAGALAFLLLAFAARRPAGPQSRPYQGRDTNASLEGKASIDSGLPPLARDRKASPYWHRGAAVVAAALILLGAWWVLLETSLAYVARNRAFPTLFALDGSWWEHHFIELQRNTLTPGRSATFVRPDARLPLARLDLRPGAYSGISFDEVYPDWRNRQQLVVTIGSDLDAPLPLAIRIHDAGHDHRYRDRFNRRLLVQPGVNRFVIRLEEVRHAPDRREMDMRRVRGIVLFAYGLEQPTHVYLGAITLE